MSNKTSFLIVSLDEGYTLTKEGKTIAKEDGSRVKEYLESSFLQSIKRFQSPDVKNMLIEIIVHENCPTNVS